MRTTAKADYAVRAQGIPANFLENILVDLRRAGVVESRRVAAGGHLLARHPVELTRGPDAWVRR